MAYKISFRSSFVKDSKKFKKNKVQKEQIQSAINELIENPELGKHLSGQMSDYFNYSFGDKPSLRILYVVYECCPIDPNRPSRCRFDDLDEIPEEECCEGMIEFVFVRTREDCTNLYKQSRKYFDNFLRE